jgi:hypothetical protein
MKCHKPLKLFSDGRASYPIMPAREESSRNFPSGEDVVGTRDGRTTLPQTMPGESFSIHILPCERLALPA